MIKNENRIATGSKILDSMLEGGYETDVITTVYGPSGSGKTTLCILCAINTVKNDKKVLYIDTEGGFSVDRVKQICSHISLNYEKALEKFIFFKPTTFENQKRLFAKLSTTVNEKIGLVIVDTIAMLYRLELGRSEDIHEINRELGRQLGVLTEIARNKSIPVLVTNQVYTDFDAKDKVNIVGGDILKYGSKCLIELQTTPNGNRRLILKKHRSLKPETEILFKIVDGGIIGTKESKGFKFFE